MPLKNQFVHMVKKLNSPKLLSKQHIVIATHQMVYGVPQALQDYLINNKVQRLLFVGLPLLFNRESSWFVHIKGKLVKKKVTQRKVRLGLLEYLLDFLLILGWTMRQKGKFHIFLGFFFSYFFAATFII
jgi:hypothetical protein